jgi:glycosyltransferase involved in cell wall biosynthesis
MPEADRPKWYVTLPANWSFCRQGSVIGLGTLSRVELHEAYSNSTVVVMPSLTETVGLPMLEAMRLGAPVLAADRPYAHEVCEDAAAYFDPLSPDDCASHVRHLLTDAEWRSQLVRRGHALIKRRDKIDSYRGMLEKVMEVAEIGKQRDAGGGNRMTED